MSKLVPTAFTVSSEDKIEFVSAVSLFLSNSLLSWKN
jgi:hypothetical protein